MLTSFVLAVTLYSAPSATWELSHLPVLFALEPSAADWEEDLEAVTAWWEEQVPGLVFSLGSLDVTRDEDVFNRIVVLIDVGPLPPNGSGCLGGLATRYVQSGKIFGGRIRLARLVRSECRRSVLAHEIGHILGLGHDEEKNSVMAEINYCEPFILPRNVETRLRAMYPRRTQFLNNYNESPSR